MSQARLLFRVGSETYGLPLDAVAEVTAGAAPSLVPLVPIEVGGVLNVRGEPLPVLDGGMLLLGVPAHAHRHVILLARGSRRLGILVAHAQIDSDLDETPLGEATPDTVLPVRWVVGNEERVGIVDPEALLERAAGLLATRPVQRGGEQTCPTGF